MRIVQCWDDGVVDDIRLTELLRRYGAKASFNLNLGRHRSKRYLDWKYQGTKPVFKLGLPELRAVYEGFTVANHSLSHPDLTRLSARKLSREVREGRERLEQHWGTPVKGFAYPFGLYDVRVQEAVRECGHSYARTVGEAEVVFPPSDPLAFHPTCHHRDPLFWDRWDRVKAQGSDAVFYFWGHSYEFVTEADWQEFEEKLVRIGQEPSAQWWDLPALFEPPVPPAPGSMVV